MAKKGGLLGALMNDHVQNGGGDSYSWHRQASAVDGYSNSRSHLLNSKQLPWEAEATTGESKRQAWINEVSQIQANMGLTWRESLQEASRRRKESIDGYKTVKQRVTESYTGRSADDVDCDECPGKYSKEVARSQDGEIIYRPNAHKSQRRHLSAEAAKNILRKYYRDRAEPTKLGMKRATKAMRLDISKKNSSRTLQTPCPTKMITVRKSDGTTYQRKIVDREHPGFAECRSNWIYRDNPSKFDMQQIDYGEGKKSPAYGKRRLYLPRS